MFVAYPLIPWIGVTAVGYGLGQVYRWDADRRRPFLLRLGLASSLAFVVIRGLNVYGDPARWMPQKTAVFTVLSFLNTTKYPPSLLFLLMTLGPALILLWAVDGADAACASAGARDRQGAALLLRAALPAHPPARRRRSAYVRYGSAHWMFESPDLAHYPFTAPPGWGYSLPVVYLVWAFVVIAMYPLCRWFAALKQRRSDACLSYL